MTFQDKIAYEMKSGSIGLVSFILAIIAVVVVWTYDSSWLNWLMDNNLAGIKWVSAQIPVYGDKFESALRFIAGEKTLILFEFGLIIKIILKLISFMNWVLFALLVLVGITAAGYFFFRAEMMALTGSFIPVLETYVSYIGALAETGDYETLAWDIGLKAGLAIGFTLILFNVKRIWNFAFN